MARKNNAFISSTLGDLLNMMDARALVDIYVRKEDGEEMALAHQYKVYEAYELPYYSKLQLYKVVGFSVYLGKNVSILVKEGV